MSDPPGLVGFNETAHRGSVSSRAHGYFNRRRKNNPQEELNKQFMPHGAIVPSDNSQNNQS